MSVVATGLVHNHLFAFEAVELARNTLLFRLCQVPRHTRTAVVVKLAQTVGHRHLHPDTKICYRIMTHTHAHTRHKDTH